MRYFHTMAMFACMLISTAHHAEAQRIEKIKYGDFNQWVTRIISESGMIGGEDKTLYEIGPTTTITGNRAYRPLGASPWGTSNAYAKVSGIVKGSNAVFPAQRGGGNRSAKLCTMMEKVKVLGLVNMDVMVAGSIFLGNLIEPVTSTKNPYSKMEMGMPYSGRPSALVFDYKLDVPNVNYRVKSSGFGGKKQIPGRDRAVAFVMLQRRWEDGAGNIYAKRVGTGGRHFSTATGWNNGVEIPIVYGDAVHSRDYGPYLALRRGATAYYARNSRGELRPIHEEGWDDPSAVPTHIIVMFSSGDSEPYVGTEGMTFYVDNVGLKM